VIVISRSSGYAKPSITLDIYGHLIPGMQEGAAQLMDELITPIAVLQLHPTAPDFLLGLTSLSEKSMRGKATSRPG
jgi:hypothetical protein